MNEEEVELLKEKVRQMLTSEMDTFSKKLNLIDIIERLGLWYHFENEIEQQLQKMNDVVVASPSANQLLEKNQKHDLSTVALHFRLLRQHGFNISSGNFNYPYLNHYNSNFKN